MDFPGLLIEVNRYSWGVIWSEAPVSTIQLTSFIITLFADAVYAECTGPLPVNELFEESLAPVKPCCPLRAFKTSWQTAFITAEFRLGCTFS